MGRNALLFLAMASVLFLSGASAQLVSDRLEGNRRICTYNTEEGPFSGQDTRAVAVSESRTCPASPPPRLGTGVLPGTAELQSWTVEQGRRICTYRYGEEIWTRAIDIEASCPIVAALLPR